jgi:NADH-quinone oxidoreductase subunit M
MAILDTIHNYLLSVMTLLPLGGAAVVWLFDEKTQQALIKRVSMAFSLVVLALALWMWVGFNEELSSELRFVERYSWVPTLNIFYHVGVDGLSVTMVVLTAIITPLALAASWGVTERVRLYFSLFLLLQTGMIGVFTALNFFHWFIYWEIGLVPMFFLIRLWGSANRKYASFKFFIYTLAGSLAMLLTFLTLYWATDTFDIMELGKLANSGELNGRVMEFVSKINSRTGSSLTVAGVMTLMFWGAFLGFAIKVPIWPFHTWLPDAHTEAPTAGSMVLAAVLLKMGVYGFLRFILPIFPAQCAENLDILLFVALASIIFGAFAAMAQNDAKRMIAYSSVNHMGYCMLGIFSIVASTKTHGLLYAERMSALHGAVLQMFNHGISSAALFFLIGVIYERTHTRKLEDFGGLRAIMPVYAGVWGIAMFSSLGLPGLNGFVSEFLVFRGSWALATFWTALALIGVVATAVFLLVMTQKMFFGPLKEKWKGLPDMTTREIIIVAPLLIFMLLIGVFPQPLIQAADLSVDELIRAVQKWI